MAESPRNYAELLTDDHIMVLNDSDTFVISDRKGNMVPGGKSYHGIYHKDTRFVSHLQLLVEGYPLNLLSSTITSENLRLSVDLVNPSIVTKGSHIKEGVLHFYRLQFLQDEIFHEQIEISNFSEDRIAFECELYLDGDFADIFEVRGMSRERRGSKDPLVQHVGGADPRLELSYLGLDNYRRTFELRIECADGYSYDESRSAICFHLSLDSHQSKKVVYSIRCKTEGVSPDNSAAVRSFSDAKNRLAPDHRSKTAYFPVLETDNEQFNHWINRSLNDLASLIASTPCGDYPYAGVPWYNTAFGRDGLITALQTLWLAPGLSKEVLLFHAANQAKVYDPKSEAQPGRILHEMRHGEMVFTGEIPFQKYYGTVDATPLFVVLAGQYYRRTGDIETIRKIWPNILASLDWIAHYGDPDGDGFVEYSSTLENGLSNQGWKDSGDAVFHDDGRLAEAPIALCEVQGYVYDAYVEAQALMEAMGEVTQAEAYRKRSADLKARFHERFWDEGKETYVLALDKNKVPCRVKNSNAGHTLYSGIASQEIASRLVRTLMSSDMYSGWGVRTIAASEARYNPMSYHNGSVWPHDVSIIAAGMSRYGFKKEASALMTGLFDASLFLPLQRLPELFCGFDRRHNEGPVDYPVACSPQAWAVGSVFLLLRSILGIRIEPKNNTIYFDKPYLPEYVQKVVVRELEIGEEEKASLVIEKNGLGISVFWPNRPPKWRLNLQF